MTGQAVASNQTVPKNLCRTNTIAEIAAFVVELLLDMTAPESLESFRNSYTSPPLPMVAHQPPGQHLELAIK